MGNIWEDALKQIDFTSIMDPLIKMMVSDVETRLEGEVMKSVVAVGVDVDKDRLVQALTDARAFYNEGYRAGYHAARMEEVERDG